MANSKAKNRGSKRPERIPVSGRRDVMTVIGKDDAYVYRWVSDDAGRIDRFIAGGYAVVDEDVRVGQDDIDSSRDIASTVTKQSGGLTQYLMRIRRDWYEEDQAAKAKVINETEEDMKRTLNNGKDGTYGNVKFS